MSLGADTPATIDHNVATNVRSLREFQGLSQDELAQRMSDRGFGFNQATIWKIEQGKRPVKISEAVALAAVLALPGWLDLASRPELLRHASRVQAYNQQVRRAYDMVKEAATEYMRAQIDLAVCVKDAEEAGVSLPTGYSDWLRDPAERAVIEARIQFAQDDAVAEQLHDAVDKIMDALQKNGYPAIIELESTPDSVDPRPKT